MHNLATLSLAALALASTSLACNRVNGVRLTNYGYPDANLAPAYRCEGSTVKPGVPNGKTLLGDGSRAKPYAAAAAKGSRAFKQCSLIYVPLLKKYFRIQDFCENCLRTQPEKRVDLYLVQSNRNIGQTPCELAFGEFNYDGNSNAFDHEVIVNPGVFALDTRPLFKDGKCYNKVSDGRVYPSRDNAINCPRSNAANAKAADDDSTGDNAPIDNTGFTDPAPIAIDAEGRNRTVVTQIEQEKPGDIPEGQADATEAPMLRFSRM